MGDNILHMPNLGLQAALNAKASGVLLDAVAYRLGDSDISFTEADEDIRGNTLIQGNIGYVEVLSEGSARFTFRIQPHQIGSGKVASEIGVYLSDNVMLGRCVFDVPLQLNEGETHEISVILSTTRCDLTVINVTIGEYSSIPNTANLVSLGHPDESDFNAVSVSDMIYNSDNTTSAGIAIKFGAGSLQWAFAGFDRVFSGNPAAGATDSEFTSTALLGSVQFSSGEVVIVYVIAGPARGQTRHFYFDSSSQTFKLRSATPFVNFTTSCTVVIWRRLGGANGGINNYPPQMTNIPDDWVLTRGGGTLPVWAPPKSTSKNLNTLYQTPGRLRITPLSDVGNGQQARYTLGNTIVKNVNYCVVALGGITQHKTAYDISSAELEFAENIPTNVPIDFRLITKEPGTGTYVDISVDKFVGDGTRTSFRISQPLEAVHYAFIHIQGLLQSPTVYTYDAATQSVVFVSPVPEGLDIEVSNIICKPSEGYSTELISTSAISASELLFLELPIKPQTKNHTFVRVSGSHVNRDLYTLVDEQLVFSSPVPKGVAVEVLIYNNVLSDGSPQTDLRGIVVDGVLTHKALKLLRHNAPDVILQLPSVNFSSGKGIRIDGDYPNLKISSTFAEQYNESTSFKISTRKRSEESNEIIFTQRINIEDDIRIVFTADFSARLGPGFVTLDGLEIVEYVIGFRTTGSNEPEYGRGIKGTGEVGLSLLQGANTNNETAYANASITQIYDIMRENLPAGYVDLIARMRVKNANIGKYNSLLTVDVNVLALPIV